MAGQLNRYISLCRSSLVGVIHRFRQLQGITVNGSWYQATTMATSTFWDRPLKLLATGARTKKSTWLIRLESRLVIEPMQTKFILEYNQWGQYKLPPSRSNGFGRRQRWRLHGYCRCRLFSQQNLCLHLRTRITQLSTFLMQCARPNNYWLQ